MHRSVWLRWPNIFLLLVPVILLRERFGIEEGPLLLALAGLSLIPLAGFLKSAVEELEELLGEFIGALLHTTSGNVAELAIALSILASFQGSGGAEIVLGSVAGVIVRTLLFLGLATFLGCLKVGHMRFNVEQAGEYSTILALAVTGLSLPTLAFLIVGASSSRAEGSGLDLVLLNRYPLPVVVAVVLLVSYLVYLAFAVFRIRTGENYQEIAQQRREEQRQRKAQRRQGGSVVQTGDQLATNPLAFAGTDALFAPERAREEQQLAAIAAQSGVTSQASVAVGVAERPAHPELAREERPRSARRIYLAEKRRARDARRKQGKGAGEHAAESAEGSESREAGEEQEGSLRARVLRGLAALVILVIAAVLIVNMSEAFAGSIEHVVSANPAFQDKEFFLGLILIPVLGGLVELFDVVEVARHGVMDVTMAMTAGGAVQMILLAVPILVIFGQLTGHPLDLVFKPLEVIVFGAATFIFMLLSRDGESTILEGVQLCSLWLLLAAVAFFLPPG
ncbi:MAG: hypothetical protein ABI068_13840 [Ktedonobacterales bacterium]